MIEYECVDNEIPLPNITSKILAKVVEYFKSTLSQLERAFEILDNLNQDLADNVRKRNSIINEVIFTHVIYICDSKATTL
jgi:hypothetical protein